MAAPKLNWAHQKDIRDKIQTIQLIKRLQGFALAEDDPQTGKPIEIDSGRLKAIEVLLRKALPDLATITIEGDPENPLLHRHDMGPAVTAFLNKLSAIAERSRNAGEPAEG